jgi:hypothetical protein
MRRALSVLASLCVLAGLTLAQTGGPAKPDFHITASYIEACSCDMFCPCYFGKSTHHGSAHFCKFNNVLKVDKGHYKGVDLAGVKAWLSGDLGAEWNQPAAAGKQPKAGWLVVTFEPSITKAQEAAMTDILLQLYPMQWDILGVDKVPFEWKVDTASGVATARLSNGKGEVILGRVKGDDPSKDAVLTNIKYWGAQSNTGFRMWKNSRNYYEGHGQKFEYKGTNGFLITIDFSGKAKPATAD